MRDAVYSWRLLIGEWRGSSGRGILSLIEILVVGRCDNYDRPTHCNDVRN